MSALFVVGNINVHVGHSCSCFCGFRHKLPRQIIASFYFRAAVHSVCNFGFVMSCVFEIGVCLQIWVWAGVWCGCVV